MNAKVKGGICGAVAAITYGTNPLGALNLYADGVNVNSVLVHRYGLAILILAGIMLARRESFGIGRRESLICLFLGALFAVSSIAFFNSFRHMDAGVACTIFFVYPVIVALVMAVFFKEKVSLVATISTVLALTGIGLLYKSGDGAALSTVGVLLVMTSAFAYAVYIVAVNKAGLRFSPVKLTFFMMLFGLATILAYSLFDEANPIQLLTTLPQWLWAVMLAVVPTIISLVLMVVAIQNIGSTPTAILGALEPVTATIIGVMVFHEHFTVRVAIGMALILIAVLLVIAVKPATPEPTENSPDIRTG